MRTGADELVTCAEKIEQSKRSADTPSGEEGCRDQRARESSSAYSGAKQSGPVDMAAAATAVIVPGESVNGACTARSPSRARR